MATLAVAKLNRNGVDPAGVAAAALGDDFVNTGKEAVLLENGSGAPINVTFETPGTVDGLAIADKVVAVPAGGARVVGPFPPSAYNDAQGKVKMTYSDVTTLTVKVLQFPL